MQRYVASKWKKTSALKENERIRPHLLPMEKMTPESLASMLREYRTVFVKPVSGMHGKGVMKVERTESGAKRYRCQEGFIKRSFDSREELYRAIRKVAAGREYLVQKGIKLLTYQGRPFDTRVMIQHNPGGEWEVTGILCRVAEPGKIVTNVHNGGRLKTIETVMRAYQTPGETRRLIHKLESLGLAVARQLERHFPGIREIGLDVALDRSLMPWIIETNTSPASFIFKHHPDKSVYRRVRRYAMAYGKLRPKRKKPDDSREWRMARQSTSKRLEGRKAVRKHGEGGKPKVVQRSRREIVRKVVRTRRRA